MYLQKKKKNETNNANGEGQQSKRPSMAPTIKKIEKGATTCHNTKKKNTPANLTLHFKGIIELAAKSEAETPRLPGEPVDMSSNKSCKKRATKRFKGGETGKMGGKGKDQRGDYEEEQGLGRSA